MKVSPTIDLGYKVVRLDQLVGSTGFGQKVQGGGRGRILFRGGGEREREGGGTERVRETEGEMGGGGKTYRQTAKKKMRNGILGVGRKKKKRLRRGD